MSSFQSVIRPAPQPMARRAALDQTQNQLAYTTLSADDDGVVTGVLAEAGQVLEAGTPIVTIARSDALDAVIALPEQRRFGLEVQTATATLWDSTHPAYRLTLREVSPDVDPASRTYTARFTIDAPDLALSLGRTLTVHLVPPTSDAVAVIPLAALLNDGRGSMVWKLSPDGTRVQPNPVEISSSDRRDRSDRQRPCIGRPDRQPRGAQGRSRPAGARDRGDPLPVAD